MLCWTNIYRFWIIHPDKGVHNISFNGFTPKVQKSFPQCPISDPQSSVSMFMPNQPNSLSVNIANTSLRLAGSRREVFKNTRISVLLTLHRNYMLCNQWEMTAELQICGRMEVHMRATDSYWQEINTSKHSLSLLNTHDFLDGPNFSMIPAT